MKKCLLVLVIGFCFKLLPAQTVFTDYTDGQLYVKFSKASVKNIEREDPFNIPLQKIKLIGTLLAKYGVTNALRPFYQAPDDNVLPYILKLKFSKISDVNLFMAELNKTPGIEYAEKVPLMKTDITPNDPTFPAQLTQINAPNAWNVFNGNSNITVAIVDNAVMWTHTDLIANTYTNTGEIAGNNIDDDGNGYIDDVNGWDVADNDNNAVPTNTLMDHGTHCAGIAGATNNNSSGIASIGWNIKIIPVKTTHDNGNPSNIDDGYGGIIYAANVHARVISCSWGSSGYSSSEQFVINYAWNKGCLIVAAAGNSSSNIQSYPGAYGNVFCVSSVSNTDVKSGFSNYGTWVDIAAPGENIYSTLPSVSTGTFGFKSGTSMATPLVAGLAALMLSNSPYMTQTDVINCISSSAVNIYTISSNTTYSTGSQLGAGRIDAYAAMNCSSGFINIAPLANFFAFPLNTCPGTPVNFYDSSLYVPTSSSWTFQSGSPATSTLTNPVVQWSLPGTYSVALSVSNANGSSTKTKISYVTVAGPIALPLAEGFETAAFLPANWTANNIFTDSIYWTRRTGIGGFGTSTACAVFDNYNIDAAGERDEMRTPKYIFSNVTSARLRFDVAYARYDASYSDSLEVKLSTDCGSSWSSIYLKGGTTLATAPDLTANTFTPSSTQWRTDSIDVTTLAAGQGNVMFSFINRGHYGQDIYLDNINLAFPSPTVNTGLPDSVCMGTSFNFTNTSLGAGSYSWAFPGGTPVTSTLSNPAVSYASGGIYTITLSGANGTTSAVVTKTINIIAAPVISITVTNANCTNSCSGTANASFSGGTPPYSYSLGLSNCSTLPCTNLCAGNYTLITSDAVGCSTSSVFAITAPVNNLNAQVSVTSASCSTCADGSGMVTLSGGLAPYTYTWLPSGGNQDAANNLTPGCYTVIAQDANGCSVSTSTCVGFYSTIGIINISQNISTLLIYPNPAKDAVTIDNKGHRFDYALYNNLGQLVQFKKANDNNAVIKLEGFAKGIYMLEVTSGNERSMKKLVVE